MALRPGSRFGVYEIRALIGAGGMGHVYRAHDDTLDRDVAIKVLPPAFSSDPRRLAALEREARVLARLNHPNIGAIYGMVESADETGQAVRGLILELLDGATLADRVATGPVPWRESVTLALQIAGALEAAHERGIVHRDLKPANIAVTVDDVVKVFDFGLAIASGPGGNGADSTLTKDGTGERRVAGTAAYMSPEQLRGRAVDKRTDVWGFGCVLFELITGRRAFGGETISDSIAAVLAREPDWTHIPRGTPDAVRRLIVHCLEKDSRRRLRDIGEARITLEQALARPPHVPARRRRLAAMAVAATVLASAGVAFLGRPGDGRRAAATTRVAVLPFENLTRDATDDWLAGAFSDALTFGLQPLSDLILVPRESVAALYREHALIGSDRLDSTVVREVSDALGVRYYVHGSYQRVGDQLRVVAQLVDANTAAIKAQESATGSTSGLLQLQDDLARQLAVSLDARGLLRTPAAGTASIEAYRAVSEARSSYGAGGFDRFSQGVLALKRAIAVDPDYALAWAELGKTYARLAAPGGYAAGDLIALRRQSLSAATRAVQLQPLLYEAHVALALAFRENHEVDGWRREAQTAIALNPRMPEAYALMGDSYLVNPTWGCARDMDGERADRYYRQAIDIDPSFEIPYSSLAINLSNTGRVDEALQVATEGVRRHPSSRLLQVERGVNLIALGRYDDAEALIRAGFAGRMPTLKERMTLGALELKRGHLESADDLFAAALAGYPESDYRLTLASDYFDVGRNADAAAALDAAFRIEPACAALVARGQFPIFRHMRSDPRIRAVLTRYGAAP